MWNTQSNVTTVDEKSIVKCNNKEYDVTGSSGIALVERIKSIARDNQIGKFDIYDSTGASLSTSEVENGDFTGPISIIRFNVAAY